jgi:hypothetical protein
VVIPKIENIHQKIYAAASADGALDMGKWESCSTTRCRAGWVVHEAGAEGYALKESTSWVFAAMQIYKASDPVNRVSPVRFYEDNDKALADMKRCAELEAQAAS